MVNTLVFFDCFFHLTQLQSNKHISRADILTIITGQFELITQKYDNLIVGIRFGKGKDYIVYDFHETFINIGTQVDTSLPFFHALTAAENTSVFHIKTKLVAWEAWKSFPIARQLSLWVMHNPFTIFDAKSWQFNMIERFVIAL